MHINNHQNKIITCRRFKNKYAKKKNHETLIEPNTGMNTEQNKFHTLTHQNLTNSAKN